MRVAALLLMQVWKRTGSAILWIFTVISAAQSLGILPFPLPFQEVGKHLPVISPIITLIGLVIASMWLAYQFHPWIVSMWYLIIQSAKRKMGVPRLLEIVKDGGQVRVLGSECSRWAEGSYDIIRKRIIDKDVFFKFLLPNPARILDPDCPAKHCPSNLQRAIDCELIDKGSVTAIETARTKLHDLRNSLQEKHRWKMEIRLFDLPLSHSMAIAIPKMPEEESEEPEKASKIPENAEIHIWPYLYRVRGDQRPYKIYENHRSEHSAMFKKYLESYRYVFDRALIDEPKGS